jgi:hypothetical protein
MKSFTIPRTGLGSGMVIAVVLAVILAVILAWQPWLAAGLTVGVAILAVTFTRPLWVIGLMLALGPLDLSFVTGGFKELLPNLGGLDMNGIRLIGISAGLGVLIVGNPELLRGLWGRNARWYLIFLLFVTMTLAYSASVNEGGRLLLKLAYPLLFFVVLSRPEATRGELDRLGDLFLIGATLAVILNPIYVVFGGVEIEQSLGTFTRLRGLGIHQNPFSFYLLVVLLFSLARYGVRAQARYLVLALAALAWMTLTLTRITFLASLVSLGGLGLYAVVVNRNWRAFAGVLLLGGLVLALLWQTVMLRTFGYVPSPGDLWALFQDPTALFQSINWQGRHVFWALLLTAFTASPIWGLGLGTSSALMKANFPADVAQVAHNEYIRLAVDGGVVAVGLFFGAAFVWLKTGFQLGRSSDRKVQEFALPLAAGILAWAVISATDNAFDYYAPFTQYMGFLLAGAVVAAREIPDDVSDATPAATGATTTM